jgi:hypothetical protein
MNYESSAEQLIDVAALSPADIDMQPVNAPAAVGQLGDEQRIAAEGITQGWDFEDGVPQANAIASIRHSDQAHELVEQEGQYPNTAMTQFIGLAIDQHWGVQLATLPSTHAEVANLGSVLANPDLPAANRPSLENALAVRQQRLEVIAHQDNQDVMHQVTSDVKGEIANLEQSTIAEMLRERVEADRLPWTMPNSNLPESVMEGVKLIHESLTDHAEALPTDMFKVAPPMKHFEGSVYSPDDDSLMQQAGIQVRDQGLYYSRAELQQAGVFFVNRVGGGEQPLFGIPIPDPDKPGEFFNVQDRSFLTREEFDKVYDYQQENGYGLDPGQDAADVQMDMIMFATMPSSRKDNVRKSYGFGSRENKYGQTRSPFVDQGYTVTYGIESTVFGSDSKQRINTTTIHLTNGHPDYPGVSEMFDTTTVAHDQQYMSTSEFSRNYYVPPTTEEQAFKSLKDGTATSREQAWVRQGDRWQS